MQGPCCELLHGETTAASNKVLRWKRTRAQTKPRKERGDKLFSDWIRGNFMPGTVIHTCTWISCFLASLSIISYFPPPFRAPTSSLKCLSHTRYFWLGFVSLRVLLGLSVWPWVWNYPLEPSVFTSRCTAGSYASPILESFACPLISSKSGGGVATSPFSIRSWLLRGPDLLGPDASMHSCSEFILSASLDSNLFSAACNLSDLIQEQDVWRVMNAYTNLSLLTISAWMADV